MQKAKLSLLLKEGKILSWTTLCKLRHQSTPSLICGDYEHILLTKKWPKNWFGSVPSVVLWELTVSVEANRVATVPRNWWIVIVVQLAATVHLLSLLSPTFGVILIRIRTPFPFSFVRKVTVVCHLLITNAPMSTKAIRIPVAKTTGQVFFADNVNRISSKIYLQQSVFEQKTVPIAGIWLFFWHSRHRLPFISLKNPQCLSGWENN